MLKTHDKVSNNKSQDKVYSNINPIVPAFLQTTSELEETLMVTQTMG